MRLETYSKAEHFQAAKKTPTLQCLKQTENRFSPPLAQLKNTGFYILSSRSQKKLSIKAKSTGLVLKLCSLYLPVRGRLQLQRNANYCNTSTIAHFYKRYSIIIPKTSQKLKKSKIKLRAILKM